MAADKAYVEAVLLSAWQQRALENVRCDGLACGLNAGTCFYKGVLKYDVACDSCTWSRAFCEGCMVFLRAEVEESDPELPGFFDEDNKRDQPDAELLQVEDDDEPLFYIDCPDCGAPATVRHWRDMIQAAIVAPDYSAAEACERGFHAFKQALRCSSCIVELPPVFREHEEKSPR